MINSGDSKNFSYVPGTSDKDQVFFFTVSHYFFNTFKKVPRYQIIYLVEETINTDIQRRENLFNHEKAYL